MATGVFIPRKTPIYHFSLFSSFTMKLSLPSSLVFIAFAVSFVQGFNDPCACGNLNYDVIRHIFPKSPNVKVQDAVFGVMKKRYDSGLSILQKALAVNEIVSVDAAHDNANWVMDDTAKCMFADIKDAVFNINNKEYRAQFQIQGRALPKGVSTAICKCRQLDANDDLDVCNVFLRDSIEARMNDVACKLRNA